MAAQQQTADALGDLTNSRIDQGPKSSGSSSPGKENSDGDGSPRALQHQQAASSQPSTSAPGPSSSHVEPSLLDSIAARLRCGLCSGPVAAALVLSCGHHFCGDCLCKWLGDRVSCPTCSMGLRGVPVRCVALDGVADALAPHLGQREREAHAARKREGSTAADRVNKMFWWLAPAAVPLSSATQGTSLSFSQLAGGAAAVAAAAAPQQASGMYMPAQPAQHMGGPPPLPPGSRPGSRQTQYGPPPPPQGRGRSESGEHHAHGQHRGGGGGSGHRRSASAGNMSAGFPADMPAGGPQSGRYGGRQQQAMQAQQPMQPAWQDSYSAAVPPGLSDARMHMGGPAMHGAQQAMQLHEGLFDPADLQLQRLRQQGAVVGYEHSSRYGGMQQAEQYGMEHAALPYGLQHTREFGVQPGRDYGMQQAAAQYGAMQGPGMLEHPSSGSLWQQQDPMRQQQEQQDAMAQQLAGLLAAQQLTGAPGPFTGMF